MPAKKWRARLGAAAQRDFASILEWTHERCGSRQARAYRDTLEEAIRALRDGPDISAARRREDIAPGVWALHIARNRQRGRHLLLYRVVEGSTIEIVRILHDSMDVARHLPR